MSVEDCKRAKEEKPWLKETLEDARASNPQNQINALLDLLERVIGWRKKSEYEALVRDIYSNPLVAARIAARKEST